MVRYFHHECGLERMNSDLQMECTWNSTVQLVLAGYGNPIGADALEVVSLYRMFPATSKSLLLNTTDLPEGSHWICGPDIRTQCSGTVLSNGMGRRGLEEPRYTKKQVCCSNLDVPSTQKSC